MLVCSLCIHEPYTVEVVDVVLKVGTHLANEHDRALANEYSLGFLFVRSAMLVGHSPSF